MHCCCRWAILLLALVAAVPAAAQPKPSAPAAAINRFPQTLAFAGAGTAGGTVHFAPGPLTKHGITAADVAQWAGRILAFHAGAWGGPGDMAWDIYVIDQRRDPFRNFGSTTVSPTRKVAGATRPGPHACVTLLVLDNIPAFLGNNDERFSTQAEFILAHEAAHCFQRMAGDVQNETVGHDPSNWFLEGSATWLAGEYFESLGRDYPSFFEIELRKRHRGSLLEINNGNNYFFKWLAGQQALKSRAAVIDFVRDMLRVPWSPACLVRLPVEKLPDERPDITGGEGCAAQPSPYERALPAWFAARQISIARVLALFGSAVVRGKVPGIRAPNLMLGDVKFNVDAGYNVARLSPGLAGALLPAPLGRVNLFGTPVGGKPGSPAPLGFVVFRIETSGPLVPPPSGYDFAVENGEDGMHVALGDKNSDSTLDASGWIRSKFLESNWIAVARDGARVGAKAQLLVRVVP